MGERELFLAVLDLRDPRSRALYLDRACAGDAALRAKVEALLKSHEEAGNFLEEPAAFDLGGTIAQTNPGDSIADTARDTPAAMPGPSPEPTQAHPEPADEPTLERDARTATSPADATDEWTPAFSGPDRMADGNGAPYDLPRGPIIRYFGDYEIQKELGRGGMGVVYQARQISLNRPVALKMIKAGVLADAAELRRFQNEAEAVALLDHPGIVPVYEVGEHGGQRYFSMKLVDGSHLAEQLALFRDNPRAAVKLMIETAEAVQHAHLRGVLHRDLKPANILIDPAGHPHITDFGLAKRIESDVELTQSGAIMGTPAYMSPEQAAGRRGTITTATDVYGLGAIFYALLTGKAPFGGESVIETLDAVRTRPPEPPTKRNARIPHDLELICLKCLEKDPAARYPTAGALSADLGRFAAGEPVSVRAARAVERLAKWARRKPTLAAAYTLGLLTVFFSGLGGMAVSQWRAAEQARAVAATARDEVAAAREALAGVEYGRTIEVALQVWREDNVPATLAFLEGTRPDLRGWEWHYVHRLCHSGRLTLNGHTGTVALASFSPDGSRVVTASRDGTAKLWDARTGVELFTLKGHTGPVHSATFSPDGSRVVTASQDGTAKVWDPRIGAEVLSLTGFTGVRWWAWFSPDGSQVIAAGDDKRAKIWDATPVSQEFVAADTVPQPGTVR